jgi:hypothetical protein
MDVVQLLLKFGADVTAQNDSDETSLDVSTEKMKKVILGLSPYLPPLPPPHPSSPSPSTPSPPPSLVSGNDNLFYAEFLSRVHSP